MLNQCLIVVCDGDELKAVQKGLGSIFSSQLVVVPIGIEGVKRVFTLTNYSAKKVLVIGLGGSISPEIKVGDVVIYESCSYQEGEKRHTKNCDRDLNAWLQKNLNAQLIKGLTTDQIIINSQDKQKLHRQTNCAVVDMESYQVMNHFESVSILRVISDNDRDDLPNLNQAITSDGKLDMFKMSMVFLQQPIKALNLINNAVISLKKLQKISQQIAKN